MPVLHAMLFYLSLLGLFFFIARPLTVFFHELGHAFAAAALTDDIVNVYIGTYGDPNRSMKLKVGRLNLFLRYNPFAWQLGLCVPNQQSVSINKSLVIVFGGPFASFLIASILGYMAFAFDFHGSLKLSLVIFFCSALVDLLVNLIPSDTPIILHSGSVVYNDGHRIQELLFYKYAPKRFKLALRLYEEQKYTEAGLLLEQLLEFRNYPIIFRYAIAAYTQDKNYEKSRAISEDFQKKRGLTSDDYVNFALAHSFLGNEAEALKLYDKSLELNPDNIFSLNNKGYTLNLRGDYEQAIHYFDRALVLNDGFAYAYNNRGLAKIKLGATEDGLNDIHHSLTLDANNSYAFLNLGIYHFDRGEFEKALQQFEKARVLDKSTYLLDKHIEEVKEKLNGMEGMPNASS